MKRMDTRARMEDKEVEVLAAHLKTRPGCRVRLENISISLWCKYGKSRIYIDYGRRQAMIDLDRERDVEFAYSAKSRDEFADFVESLTEAEEAQPASGTTEAEEAQPASGTTRPQPRVAMLDSAGIDAIARHIADETTKTFAWYEAKFGLKAGQGEEMAKEVSAAHQQRTAEMLRAAGTPNWTQAQWREAAAKTPLLTAEEMAAIAATL